MADQIHIINLTPHPITLVGDGTSVTILPQQVPARCAHVDQVIGSVGLTDDDFTDFAIPVVRSTFGSITGLPDPQPGVVYVASLLVAQAAQRPDVVAVARPVRDQQGRIVAAGALARVDEV